MLDDKKFQSLHSAALEVVSKNEDLRQKELEDRYGKYATEQKSEELQESIFTRAKNVLSRIKNKDLIDQYRLYRYLVLEAEWGSDYWCNIGKFHGPDGPGQTAKKDGRDDKEAAVECGQMKSELAKYKKELARLESELKAKMGPDWKTKFN